MQVMVQITKTRRDTLRVSISNIAAVGQLILVNDANDDRFETRKPKEA